MGGDSGKAMFVIVDSACQVKAMLWMGTGDVLDLRVGGREGWKWKVRKGEPQNM